MLFVPGDVFQVQATAGHSLWGGVYHSTDFDALADHIEALTRLQPDVQLSVTVNPLQADQLSAGPLAPVAAFVGPAQVRERRWLPVIITGEAEAARELASRVGATLGAEGWPAPVLCYTPEGAALLYRVRLRMTREDEAVLAGTLRTLCSRFLAPQAEVSNRGLSPACAVGIPGAGPEARRWTVVKAPSWIDMVPREELTADRSPEVHPAEPPVVTPHPPVAPPSAVTPSVVSAAAEARAEDVPPGLPDLPQVQDEFESGLQMLDEAFGQLPIPGGTHASLGDLPPMPIGADEADRDDPFARAAFAVAQDAIPTPVVAVSPAPPAPPAPEPQIATVPFEVLRDPDPVARPSAALVIPGSLPVFDGTAILDRYRARHQHRSGSVPWPFEPLNRGGHHLTGLVLVEGPDPTVNAVLAMQVLWHAVVERGDAAVAGGLLSFNQTRGALVDAVVSYLSGLSLDVLHHGQPRQPIDPVDGLRLTASARRRLTAAVTALDAAAHRVHFLDLEVMPVPQGVRPREWLLAMTAEARRRAECTRTVWVLDDWSGWLAASAHDDPVLELQAYLRNQPDDVVIILSEAPPDQLRHASTVQVSAVPDATADGAAPLVTVSSAETRRSRSRGSVRLRFNADVHRFVVPAASRKSRA